MALMDSIIRINVTEALRQAEEEGSDEVTISVGLLKKLCAAYEERGEALEPFAILADTLTSQQPDTAPVRPTILCGDLRAARSALPR